MIMTCKPTDRWILHRAHLIISIAYYYYFVRTTIRWWCLSWVVDNLRFASFQKGVLWSFSKLSILLWRAKLDFG